MRKIGLLSFQKTKLKQLESFSFFFFHFLKFKTIKIDISCRNVSTSSTVGSGNALEPKARWQQTLPAWQCWARGGWVHLQRIFWLSNQSMPLYHCRQRAAVQSPRNRRADRHNPLCNSLWQKDLDVFYLEPNSGIIIFHFKHLNTEA